MEHIVHSSLCCVFRDCPGPRFIHVPESGGRLSFCEPLSLWLLFMLPAETGRCSLVDGQLSVLSVCVSHFDLSVGQTATDS